MSHLFLRTQNVHYTFDYIFIFMTHIIILSLLLSTGGVRTTLGRRLLCSRHNGRLPRGLPLHDHVQPQVLRHIMYADYENIKIVIF